MISLHRKTRRDPRANAIALVRVLFALSLVTALAPDAVAHPLAPSLLELRAEGEGRFGVRFKTAMLQARGAPHRPRLPDRCRTISEATSVEEGTGVVSEWTVNCGAASLVGETIAIDGLVESSANAVVRVVGIDGRVVQALLSPRDPIFVIAAEPSALEVAYSYVVLGVEHLAFGFDHVLFVLGLLMLIKERRSLLLTVTAFTAGHSVTLALATLGIVRFPTSLVEVAIAFSLLLLAAEIPLGRSGERPSLFERRPWLMAAGFGLLHGFGFAGALSDIGLPANEVPLALVSFNVGIELGQLALVVIALALVRLARAARLPVASPRLRLATVYGIGALAGYWVIERMLGALGIQA